MQLFADRTYEAILAEMLAQAPAGWTPGRAPSTSTRWRPAP
ncbi:MAG: hypothetical protein ACLSAF_15415 [Intestinimonas sp.]